MKTLDKLPINYEAYVDEIKCDDVALRQHILNMGITPNVEILLVKKAPMGDPLEFRVRGYELSLRKDDASKITIKNIHPKDSCKRKNVEFKEIEHSQKGENEIYLTSEKAKNPKLKTKLNLALVGNQNCGKTTLFNRLTGSN